MLAIVGLTATKNRSQKTRNINMADSGSSSLSAPDVMTNGADVPASDPTYLTPDELHIERNRPNEDRDNDSIAYSTIWFAKKYLTGEIEGLSLDSRHISMVIFVRTQNIELKAQGIERQYQRMQEDPPLEEDVEPEEEERGKKEFFMDLVQAYRTQILEILQRVNNFLAVRQ